MLNNNAAANNNRLVQITEQVFDPIRVPIAIGNEVYVMSQQDVRNVVETRLISWEKMQGNNSVNCAAQGAFISPPNQVVVPNQTQLDWEMKCIPENPTNRFSCCKQTSTSDLKKVKFCI